MKNLRIYIVIALLFVLITPSIVHAAWWNPFSWHIWSIFNFSKNKVLNNGWADYKNNDWGIKIKYPTNLNTSFKVFEGYKGQTTTLSPVNSEVGIFITVFKPTAERGYQEYKSDYKDAKALQVDNRQSNIYYQKEYYKNQSDAYYSEILIIPSKNGEYRFEIIMNHIPNQGGGSYESLFVQIISSIKLAK